MNRAQWRRPVRNQSIGMRSGEGRQKKIINFVNREFLSRYLLYIISIFHLVIETGFLKTNGEVVD